MDAYEKELVSQRMALRRYAMKLTNGRVADAEDMVQDVFVNALRFKHLYDRTLCDSVRPWLFAIMRNIHINNLRKFALRNPGFHLDIHVDPEYAENTSPSLKVQPGQYEHIRLRQVLEFIVNCGDKLSETFVATVVNNEDYPDYARRSGIPVGTVKSRVRIMRARLTAAGV